MMENFGAKMMSKFFRPVNNVVWDLMSGRIGVKTNEGIITLEGAGDEAQVVQNLFDEFGWPCRPSLRILQLTRSRKAI